MKKEIRGGSASRCARSFAVLVGSGALLLPLALSGCSAPGSSPLSLPIEVPTDPDGTLDRIEGGVLHAGFSPENGLIEEQDGRVTGPLADLVEDFADEHDAEVRWTVGSEESLVGALERAELDLAVGGMTSETPWIDRAGMSRGYSEIPGAAGRDIVVLVPLGENRLLFELETFLDEELTR